MDHGFKVTRGALGGTDKLLKPARSHDVTPKTSRGVSRCTRYLLCPNPCLILLSAYSSLMITPLPFNSSLTLTEISKGLLKKGKLVVSK